MRFTKRVLTPSTGALFAALLATAVFAAPAAASTVTYNKHTKLEFPGGDQKLTKEYSTLTVVGQEGPITDVDLSVNDINFGLLGSLNLALVSPSGETEVAMSWNCGDTDTVGRTFTFDQSAGAGMPSAWDGDCPGSTYAPSVGTTTDTFDGLPGGPRTHNFDNFKNENANGTWTLHVYKNCYGVNYCGSNDSIDDGWSLKITTADNVSLDLPAGNATSGAASPFPMVRNFSGSTGLITDLNVRLDGIWHSYPDDIDMMLQGPQGQTVMLMSDACGSHPVNGYGWSWDDEAPSPMADEGGGDVCATSAHRPTAHQSGDSLPAPAPAGPYSQKLEAFDLTDPNGQWKLWVADDFQSGEGFFTNQFQIYIQTRPRALVAFRDANVEVAEGETGELTLIRSGAPSYTDGSMELASVPETAAAEGDYTPVSTTVHFAPGQTEKTVPVSVLADADAEPAETFKVQLYNPSGDASYGSTTAVEVTIPANGHAPDGGKPHFGERTLITLGLASKRIPGRGPVRVSIRNANPFAVTGRLSGSSKKRFGAAVKRRIKLATRAFSVGPHTSSTVAMELPKKLRKLLRRNGRLGLRVTANVVDPAGTARTVRWQLTPKLRAHASRSAAAR